MKLPKYLLVEHTGKEWIIRTRNPPLLAEVITWPDGQITFDLAPQKIVLSLTESQIAALTASLLRWYQHAKGYPYGYASPPGPLTLPSS